MKIVSTPNICSIDLSKAFDKVNHFGMYIKLMSYDDFCVFKMAAGHHLRFWQKWNLNLSLFPGRQF